MSSVLKLSNRPCDHKNINLLFSNEQIQVSTVVSPDIRERNKQSTTRQIQHTTGVKDGPQPGQCHGHCQHGAGVQLGDGHHGDGRGLGHLPGWISDVESRKVNKKQNHIQAKNTQTSIIQLRTFLIKAEMETKSCGFQSETF